ncbi:hypothetical protein GCM10010211_60730 [Streptomyces albospinus]|uniref:Uncharacterized protein n=1 Tax=Streptomyces albospinus TaxID=285515 RepID=A0ABQ2VHV7_9ACTN|nr:hypothetical protein GCM10010211_60730 [Streptomyces albospinus]
MHGEMVLSYCERHELHNCADCTPDGRVRRAGHRSDGGGSKWAGWPKGAIIIHYEGKAHLPGCTHLSESAIRAPKFGWVTDPAAGAWRRLSASAPLRPTQGNISLAGVSRCETCDATQ